MTAATIPPVAIELDQDIGERIKRLADLRHRNLHGMVREAIDQYIDREEKRDGFRQDALRAWEEYQSTGLHATHDEVDAWLGRLEAGGNAPPPACHI